MARGTPTPSLEERKKHLNSIIKGEYPEEADATVGENRGQLFVRIPKVISERLQLQKGDTLHFTAKNESGGVAVSVAKP